MASVGERLPGGAGPDRPHASSAASCAACGGTDLVPHLFPRSDAPTGGFEPTTNRFGIALANIVRCPSCGHMQLDPMPGPAELGRLYATAETEGDEGEEEGLRLTARDTLDRIERHVGPGRLLDVGCWLGFLLAEAAERGWHARGVEPSAYASGYARERLGLEVETGDLTSSQLPGGAFDAVHLGDVIEHLPDPGDALARIASLLAPGGAVSLVLPDSGSRLARAMGRRWWSVLPTHVQYFTRHSVSTLLRARGFEPLQIGTAPKAFSVEYYLGRFEGYSEQLGRALVGVGRRTGVARRIWAPDLRDRMHVIARAPG